MELQATSQSRRSPTNVSTGAVTATLLARKFVDYIGNGLLLCPWGRAVPHDQGTCQVWSAVYSQVNDGIVVGWGDSSLDDVLQSITFLTIPFMEGILMVDGDLLFVGGGQLSWFCVLVQFLLDHLLDEMVCIAVVGEELSNTFKFTVDLRPVAAMGESPIDIG